VTTPLDDRATPRPVATTQTVHHVVIRL
jgi:hypothetical protein